MTLLLLLASVLCHESRLAGNCFTLCAEIIEVCFALDYPRPEALVERVVPREVAVFDAASLFMVAPIGELFVLAHLVGVVQGFRLVFFSRAQEGLDILKDVDLFCEIVTCR